MSNGKSQPLKSEKNVKTKIVTAAAKNLGIMYLRAYSTNAIKYYRVKLFHVNATEAQQNALLEQLKREYKNVEMRILHTPPLGRFASIEFKLAKGI